MAKTVIIADDDRIISQIFSDRLKKLGLSVMRSPDATHALVGAQRIRPDLIILDVNMPGGNGLAVAEMLASDPDCCNLPVIIHTVNDDETTRRRCSQRGHYYVHKSPRSWDEVKSIVCKELNITPDGAQTDEPLGVSVSRP